MTIDELLAAGHHKMRLPHFNPHAYLEVLDDGPWATLYDVGAGVGGGKPIPLLIHTLGQLNLWEEAKT